MSKPVISGTTIGTENKRLCNSDMRNCEVPAPESGANNKAIFLGVRGGQRSGSVGVPCPAGPHKGAALPAEPRGAGAAGQPAVPTGAHRPRPAQPGVAQAANAANMAPRPRRGRAQPGPRQLLAGAGAPEPCAKFRRQYLKIYTDGQTTASNFLKTLDPSPRQHSRGRIPTPAPSTARAMEAKAHSGVGGPAGDSHPHRGSRTPQRRPPRPAKS